MLRDQSAVFDKRVGSARRAGQAPDIQTIIRNAQRSVDVARDAVETWSRQLRRTRTGLADGRRLLADGTRSNVQFKRLLDRVESVLAARQSAVEEVMENRCLSSVRRELAIMSNSGKNRETEAFLLSAFLPKEPTVLLAILGDIQTIHSQTMAQMKSLQRRFELLTNELKTQMNRLKTQHRTLRASVAPFVRSAHDGRRKVDASQIELARATAVIHLALGEAKNKDRDDKVVMLRSREAQLLRLINEHGALQALQLEADAAEIVYASLLETQKGVRDTGFLQGGETAMIENQIKSILETFWHSSESFPQEVLGWLEASIRALITEALKK